MELDMNSGICVTDIKVTNMKIVLNALQNICLW